MMTQSLESLASRISGASNLEDLTRPMLEILEKVTHLESTYLTTINEAEGVQRILYARNVGDLEIPEGLTVPWTDTLCKRALQEKRFLTKDVPACWGDSAAAAALGLKTYLSSPVYTDDGELYGTLCGASTGAVDVDPTVSDVLELFSRLIAQQASREKMTARATARADAAEARASQLQFIAEFGALCLSAPDTQLLLASVARSFRNRSAWTLTVPFISDGALPCALQTEHHQYEALIREMLNDARYSDGYQPVFVNKRFAENALREELDNCGIDPHTELFLMTAASGDFLSGGVLLAGNEKLITDSEKALVQSCWQTLTLYAEREHEHEQLEAANAQLLFHAHHDPLTQLANRRYLIEEMRRMLAHAVRTQEKVSVVFIDLDGFKRINDEFGHDVGDDFLRAIADRLRSAARKGDLVARYGGDEFVLVGVHAEDQTENAEQALTERLHNVLAGTYELPKANLQYAGPSIGVVIWQGEDVPDIDELLATADKAMYQVKMSRRAARG